MANCCDSEHVSVEALTAVAIGDLVIGEVQIVATVVVLVKAVAALKVATILVGFCSDAFSIMICKQSGLEANIFMITVAN